MYIEKPIYQVRVSWPGASPADVDREVVNRLERELSSLNGVEQLTSSSRTGRATVTLTYSLEQDMDKALILLLNNNFNGILNIVSGRSYTFREIFDLLINKSVFSSN